MFAPVLKDGVVSTVILRVKKAFSDTIAFKVVGAKEDVVITSRIAKNLILQYFKQINYISEVFVNVIQALEDRCMYSISPSFTYKIFFRCKEQCLPGTHGVNCANQCKCQNDGHCDAITGLCDCPPGFTVSIKPLFINLLNEITFRESFVQKTVPL